MLPNVIFNASHKVESFSQVPIENIIKIEIVKQENHEALGVVLFLFSFLIFLSLYYCLLKWVAKVTSMSIYLNFLCVSSFLCFRAT